MVALLEILPVGIRWFCETIEVEVAIAPKPVERQLVALCLPVFSGETCWTTKCVFTFNANKS